MKAYIIELVKSYKNGKRKRKKKSCVFCVFQKFAIPRKGQLDEKDF
jgi:hypothetical protein